MMTMITTTIVTSDDDGKEYGIWYMSISYKDNANNATIIDGNDEDDNNDNRWQQRWQMIMAKNICGYSYSFISHDDSDERCDNQQTVAIRFHYLLCKVLDILAWSSHCHRWHIWVEWATEGRIHCWNGRTILFVEHEVLRRTRRSRYLHLMSFIDGVIRQEIEHRRGQ